MGFAAQQQSVPGVQAQMDPIPDCGENSYQGSGKLLGKRRSSPAAIAASGVLSRSPSRAKVLTS